MKLRELLTNYDFYLYDEELKRPLCHNTRTARVYMGQSPVTSPFFEIGFGANITANDNINHNDFLREDILNRTVSRFYCDNDLGIMFVFALAEIGDE